jgi:lipoprotein-anchoring transpeptidase ErfK/SrfK
MTRSRARKPVVVLLATVLAAALVLLVVPAASAANVPSRFPAAGTLVWPTVSVRTQPSANARRITTLYELRRDRLPQIVLAIGMRRIGAVDPAPATLVLRNAAGAGALQLTAREAGRDGNSYRVSVFDSGEQDQFAVFVGGVELLRFTYVEGDIAGLAAQVNASPAPFRAAALSTGPLTPIGPTPLAGGRDGDEGEVWYRLNLPIRPFGQTGWIPADAAIVRPTTRRVVVHRRARTLSVFQGSRRIFHTRVAVGRPDRQTPLGNFYVAAKYVPPRNALVSTYALELSAPAGLPDFLRGGVVGIHGTPATYTIGRAASNGCIRVTPGVASALRRLVPLGTPVQVVR